MLYKKDHGLIDRSTFEAPWYRDYPPMAYEHDDATPIPDCFVRRYVRLSTLMPQQFGVRIPTRFGEIGWEVEGHPVNRATGYLQARVNTMYCFGVLGILERVSAPAIVEVGGGAGEMGYFFCRAFPDSTWIDCDLPESLAKSAMHLAVLLPERQHRIYVGSTPLGTRLMRACCCVLRMRSPLLQAR